MDATERLAEILYNEGCTSDHAWPPEDITERKVWIEYAQETLGELLALLSEEISNDR